MTTPTEESKLWEVFGLLEDISTCGEKIIEHLLLHPSGVAFLDLKGAMPEDMKDVFSGTLNALLRHGLVGQAYLTSGKEIQYYPTPVATIVWQGISLIASRPRPPK